MKNTSFALNVISLLAGAWWYAASAGATPPPEPAAATVHAQPADWLFTGNHIVPMTHPDHHPTALAVIGDRIAWVGSAEDAARWRGEETTHIELGDRALLPGFIDAHGHLSFLALTNRLANVASPPVGPVMDIPSLQETLADYIRERDIPPGQWVVGMGYDDSLLAERRHPTRIDLDEVSDTHPIALMHVSGHLATANTRALTLAGISADTPDPDGGHIRREADGQQPNGVLEETATFPLRGFMLQPGDDPVADVQDALDVYASFGTTTVQDGASSPEGIALLQAAAASGGLDLDVVVYPVANEPAPLPADMRLGEYRNRLKFGGIKMVLDGSPQGKTAFLTEPYAVPPHGQDAHYLGYPMVPFETVNRTVAHYLSRRTPIIAHANGDAAADMLISAVQAATRDAERDNHRTVMIHAQTVREDQLDAMAEAGIIPSYFSAHTFYWGDWHRDSVLGRTRAERISPTRSTVRRGMPFTVHNDAPIVPPDMPRLLWATTNRLTRSGRVLGDYQRLSIYEALEAVTRHAAYQYFEEADKGTLEVGKLADLVLLSRDPLAMPSHELLDLQVLGTWSRGNRVFNPLGSE